MAPKRGGWKGEKSIETKFIILFFKTVRHAWDAGLLSRRGVSLECSFGDLNSQLDWFVVNSGSAPERIGLCQFPNKIKEFRDYRRLPRPLALGFKTPEQLEVFFRLTHHGLRFDNDQSLLPVAQKRER